MPTPRLSSTRKKNHFKFNTQVPGVTFILSTMPTEDLEKTIESMPDYETGRNFEFQVKPEKNVKQKKHRITSLRVPTLTKAKTKARLSPPTTKKIPHNKITKGQYLGPKPQNKNNDSSWTTYPSRLYKIITSMHPQQTNRKEKPITPLNKNNSLHLFDMPLSTYTLTQTGVPQTNSTFLLLNEAIKKSTKTMKETYPYLNTKYKDRQFKNVFHDYFNDLLVWYNDTLNKNIDKVWEPVTGLHDDIRAIPNKLAGLTKEVELMKQYLASFEVLQAGAFSF